MIVPIKVVGFALWGIINIVQKIKYAILQDRLKPLKSNPPACWECAVTIIQCLTCFTEIFPFSSHIWNFNQIDLRHTKNMIICYQISLRRNKYLKELKLWMLKHEVRHSEMCFLWHLVFCHLHGNTVMRKTLFPAEIWAINQSLQYHVLE